MLYHVMMEKFYWQKELDEIIEQYNVETQQKARERLWLDILQPDFIKLIQGVITYQSNACSQIIKQFGVEYLEQICLSHIATVISQYKKEKGKSFGYFSAVIKFYLIALNKKQQYIAGKEVSDSVNFVDVGFDDGEGSQSDRTALAQWQYDEAQGNVQDDIIANVIPKFQHWLNQCDLGDAKCRIQSIPLFEQLLTGKRWAKHKLYE